MFVPLISLTFDLPTHGKYKIMSMFENLFNHLEREHTCKYVLEENCISLKEFFMWENSYKMDGWNWLHKGKSCENMRSELLSLRSLVHRVVVTHSLNPELGRQG